MSGERAPWRVIPPRWRRRWPPPSVDWWCCPSGRGRLRWANQSSCARRCRSWRCSTARWASAALQAKQYDKARERFLKAIALDPDNLADVYQLSVTMLEPQPSDALGFWYAARAIAIARAAHDATSASSIDKYARAHYVRYHGSEEGWDGVLTKAASGRSSRRIFSRGRSRA